MPLHDITPGVRCVECNEPIVLKRTAFMCWRAGHEPEYRHYIQGWPDVYGGYSHSCFSRHHSLTTSHQQDCLAGINPTGITDARQGHDTVGSHISALDLPARRYGILMPNYQNNGVDMHPTGDVSDIIEANDDTIWPEGHILKLPACWARVPTRSWEFIPTDGFHQEEWYALSSRTTELFGHPIPRLSPDSDD